MVDSQLEMSDCPVSERTEDSDHEKYLHHGRKDDQQAQLSLDIGPVGGNLDSPRYFAQIGFLSLVSRNGSFFSVTRSHKLKRVCNVVGGTRFMDLWTNFVSVGQFRPEESLNRGCAD